MDAVRLGLFSHVEWLSAVPGQLADERYGCVSRGIPMPAEGLGYLVSDAGNRLVRIHAYVDAFGRVFIADGPVAMPPAVPPDLQIKAYSDEGAEPRARKRSAVRSAKPDEEVRGSIEIAVPKARPLRVGEFSCRRDRYTVVNSRVELGGAGLGLGLLPLCCVSYLAYCRFPQREGVSLVSSSVRSVMSRLRGHDFFAALTDAYDEACKADSHPRVHAPGVVSYFARMVRDGDLTGLTASGVASGQPEGQIDDEALEGIVRSLDFSGPVSIEQAGELLGGVDISELLRSFLDSMGIQGVQVLGAKAGRNGSTPEPPDVRLVRTTGYANTFYLGFDRSLVSQEGLSKLFEAEGVLNRFLFLVEELDRCGLVQTASEGQCAELDLNLVGRIGERSFTFIDDADSMDDLREDLFQADPYKDGDLAIRIAFARSCESMRLPYRLEYAMGFDARSSTLVVDVASPVPNIMPRFSFASDDTGADGWHALAPSERNEAAARYAAQLAVVAAAAGFATSRRVQRVVVNAWHVISNFDERCVLSVDFGRSDLLDRLDLLEHRSRRAFLDDPLAFVSAMPHRLDYSHERGFSEIQPIRALDDAQMSVPLANASPDTDARPLAAPASRLLHARVVSDLGIYEEAGRKQVASDIVEALRNEGDLAGIAVARTAADESDDAVLREACRRVCDGISRGEFVADKPEAITFALADAYGLKERMGRAAGLMRDDPGSCRVQLESIVETCEMSGWFADSSTSCYRYFDSYAARAVYSLRCAEEDAAGRDVRLLADEYYLAHYRLSTLLADTLDDCETAIDHARRCVELAPAVANGYLRLARCYFGVFDYVSEIETIKRMLRIAWNPSDVAMGLYWMGYALCMTGDVEAGFACYQKSASLDRSLTEVAATEVAEFASRFDVDPHERPAPELDRILVANGIDLAQVQENVEFIVRAASAAVEAGSYALGRTLLGSATMYLHDDALSPVIESLHG